MAVEDRPSFLQLRSHIGWPSPHLTDSPKATVSRSSPRRSKRPRRSSASPRRELLGAGRSACHVPGPPAPVGAPTATPGPSSSRRVCPQALSPGHDGTRSGAARHSAVSRRSCPPGRPATSSLRGPLLKSSLNAIFPDVPGLVSGGADLTGNTGTMIDGQPLQSKEHPRAG